MSKYVIIGDLEGRTIWREIVEKENPDVTIFLGDYVASRCVAPEQELETLKEVLDYKEANPDKVILLRGNHDVQPLYYWAQCWPQAPRLTSEWLSENKDRFISNTQWVYQIPDTNIICSHAGIGEKFLDNVCKYFKSKDGCDFNIYDEEQLLNHINDIPPCEVFAFNGGPWDSSGYSDTQPCTWIRPETLAKCAISGYTQVVGHTRTRSIEPIKSINDDNIWMCDSLGWQNYLVIEDGEFKPKSIK